MFEGALRSIIGSLTVEEMINNRDRPRQETLDSAGDEMSRLGLVVDALQIREIVDPTGYIKNLAAPHAAEVQKQARIAQAKADQEATQREQEAHAVMAEATKMSQIKQAGYFAEVETERAKAPRPARWPRPSRADRQGRGRRPPGRARGQGERQATRVMGEPDGAAIEPRGLAKAKAIRAACEALTENQGAVIAQGMAERMPELVRRPRCRSSTWAT